MKTLRNVMTVGPAMMDLVADMLETMIAENESLKYTLTGVMHFVDKWLDRVTYEVDKDLTGQEAIDRAAEARRVALEAIESLTAELAKAKMERDAAVEDLSKTKDCASCAHNEERIELEKDYDIPSQCLNCRDITTMHLWRGVCGGGAT